MEVQRFNWQQLDHNNSKKIEAQELQDLAANFDLDGDGELSRTEGQAANIHNAQDLAAVNEALQQAALMDPNEILFAVPQPNPVAPSLKKLESALEKFAQQWQDNMASLQDESHQLYTSDHVTPEMRQKIQQRLMQALSELDDFRLALKKYPDTTDLQKYVFLQDGQVDPADLEALLEDKLNETQQLFARSLTHPAQVAAQVPDPPAAPKPRTRPAPQEAPSLPPQAQDLIEIMDQLSQAREHISEIADPARRADFEKELAELEETLLPKEAQQELLELINSFEKSLPRSEEYRELREELEGFKRDHRDGNDALDALKATLTATKVIAKLSKVNLPFISGAALSAIQEKLGEIVDLRARQKLEAFASGLLFRHLKARP